MKEQGKRQKWGTNNDDREKAPNDNRTKNKSRGKAQKAKGKAAATAAIVQESRSWVILLRFALCALPFDLFFLPYFCLLRFAF
jgi:hypothetical protein